MRNNMKKRRNYLTLVKVLAFLVMLSLVLFSPGLAYAEETTVVSISAPNQVNPGEEFSVSVFVQPAATVAGVQFNLTFDSSLVTVESVEEGQFLSQGLATTYFNAGVIDNVAGTVNSVVGAITTPGQAVSTEGTLATLTLTAGVESGTCPLTLSNVVVGDIDGISVPISVINDQVAINQPPVLNSIGDRSVNEGELITFTISAEDADGDNMTYSASNLPSGATFDPATKTFSWTPRYDQAGTYANVHFEASDSSLFDSEDITITVIKLYEDWDVNGDTTVDVLDMILVGQHWGEAGLTGWIREDVNEDGAINVLDMILIGQNWNE
jgi:hypothetical protein